MLKAADRLTGNFPKLTVPVFIIHGTVDKATRPAGSQRFYDTAGSKDKTLKLYEGHYHDLLNDFEAFYPRYVSICVRRVHERDIGAGWGR